MRQRGIFEKVSSSGEWWIRYADAAGRIRREKVGTFEEAQARLALRKQEAKVGVQPRLSRQRRSASFRKIAVDALAHADENKRSARNDHSRMVKLLDWFGDRAADSITPLEIERRFQLEKWTAATWNRYRALVSLTYRLAIRSGKMKENPARLVRHKTETTGDYAFCPLRRRKVSGTRFGKGSRSTNLNSTSRYTPGYVKASSMGPTGLIWISNGAS